MPTLIELVYTANSDTKPQAVAEVLDATPGVAEVATYPQTLGGQKARAYIVTVDDGPEFTDHIAAAGIIALDPTDGIVDLAIEWLAYVIRRTTTTGTVTELTISGAIVLDPTDGEPSPTVGF